MSDLLIDPELAARLTAERDRAKLAALAASESLAAYEAAAVAAQQAVESAEKERTAAWGTLRRINGALNSLGAYPEGQHYPTMPETIVRFEIERYPAPVPESQVVEPVDGEL